MNEHAGPACALSGLIVGIFAVLLHDRNPPPPVPKSLARSVSTTPRVEGSKPESPASIGPPRPVARTAPPPSSGLARAPGPVLGPRKSEGPVPEPERSPDLTSRVDPPTRPSVPTSRPPFAVVEPGESLSDVAARVYGSKDASEALWKANRDQVARVDSPLSGGTLLRTP
jgi:hypothetical protein